MVHAATLSLRPQYRALERDLPPALKPILRAYAFGYATSTFPRLLTSVLVHFSKRRKNTGDNCHGDFIHSFIQIVKGGLQIQRFATFCASLVGGSVLLEGPLRLVIQRFLKGWSAKLQSRVTTWLSTFIAAWYSLKLLQSKNSAAFIDDVPIDTANGPQVRPIHFAGRTMDLTLFALTRALDVIVGELWSQRKVHRTSVGNWSKPDKLIATLADPAIFASSSTLIMWAWIYSPDRLPSAYNKWIKSAAAVDARLLLALRKMRYGEIKYGETNSDSPTFLEDMCRTYNWPLSYADPVQSIPFPCEMVHMGTGASCEYHALSRLTRSFLWAFSTYLPLNLILSLLRNRSKKSLIHALKSSTRSSAFLGTFISLFYYGVCLARTRLGPHILGTSPSAAQQLDSGICIGNGCALCGWSILLENSGRRKELGLFVAPRALATLFPRRYEMRDQWIENVAFAGSAAVVFTCVRENPERVRGVLGKVLRKVLVE